MCQSRPNTTLKYSGQYRTKKPIPTVVHVMLCPKPHVVRSIPNPKQPTKANTASNYAN